ncbi:hypothetical protein MLD38_034311 [Melastoma candidum]|uniref:Uncharacterized protein n=1 Tax=Melastoma candidum TaxID=119954 RepID=A0ACB9MA22_9MYRT|nr:hypothetical protein MLD38_034311 [Melastoma candidum]
MRNQINATVTVHCQSKDDDLGFHDLQPDEKWSFSFRLNLFFTTLFFCSFRWPGHFHHYYVYKASNDLSYEKIYWAIKAAGPCYHRLPSQKLKCRPWKP